MPTCAIPFLVPNPDHLLCALFLFIQLSTIGTEHDAWVAKHAPPKTRTSLSDSGETGCCGLSKKPKKQNDNLELQPTLHNKGPRSTKVGIAPPEEESITEWDDVCDEAWNKLFGWVGDALEVFVAKGYETLKQVQEEERAARRASLGSLPGIAVTTSSSIGVKDATGSPPTANPQLSPNALSPSSSSSQHSVSSSMEQKVPSSFKTEHSDSAYFAGPSNAHDLRISVQSNTVSSAVARDESSNQTPPRSPIHVKQITAGPPGRSDSISRPVPTSIPSSSTLSSPNRSTPLAPPQTNASTPSSPTSKLMGGDHVINGGVADDIAREPTILPTRKDSASTVASPPEPTRRASSAGIPKGSTERKTSIIHVDELLASAAGHSNTQVDIPPRKSDVLSREENAQSSSDSSSTSVSSSFSSGSSRPSTCHLRTLRLPAHRTLTHSEKLLTLFTAGSSLTPKVPDGFDSSLHPLRSRTAATSLRNSWDALLNDPQRLSNVFDDLASTAVLDQDDLPSTTISSLSARERVFAPIRLMTPDTRAKFLTPSQPVPRKALLQGLTRRPLSSPNPHGDEDSHAVVPNPASPIVPSSPTICADTTHTPIPSKLSAPPSPSVSGEGDDSESVRLRSRSRGPKPHDSSFISDDQTPSLPLQSKHRDSGSTTVSGTSETQTPDLKSFSAVKNTSVVPRSHTPQTVAQPGSLTPPSLSNQSPFMGGSHEASLYVVETTLAQLLMTCFEATVWLQHAFVIEGSDRGAEANLRLLHSSTTSRSPITEPSKGSMVPRSSTTTPTPQDGALASHHNHGAELVVQSRFSRDDIDTLDSLIDHTELFFPGTTNKRASSSKSTCGPSPAALALSCLLSSVNFQPFVPLSLHTDVMPPSAVALWRCLGSRFCHISACEDVVIFGRLLKASIAESLDRSCTPETLYVRVFGIPLPSCLSICLSLGASGKVVLHHDSSALPSFSDFLHLHFFV